MCVFAWACSQDDTGLDTGTGEASYLDRVVFFEFEKINENLKTHIVILIYLVWYWVINWF